MVGGFQAGFFGSSLMGSMAGEYSRDIEDDRGLLKRQRVLRSGLVREGIEPGSTEVRRTSQQAGT